MPIERNARINERNAREYWARLPEKWAYMADEIRESKTGLWLMGPANYIIKSGGLWAVDPGARPQNEGLAIMPRLARDLESLEFVLITHLHSDHYSSETLEALGALRPALLVPECLPEKQRERLNSVGLRVRTVRPGERLDFKGASVWVLPGRHYDRDAPQIGVPSVGYLVETPKTRFWFPGDVRDYEICETQKCDIMLAHLWLGRSKALKLPCEPELSRFCEFILRARPGRALIAHLYDFDREPAERWVDTHAKLVARRLADSGIKISAPRLGERVSI